MRRLVILALAAAAVGLVPANAHAQRYLGAFTGYSYGGAVGNCTSLFSDCPDRRTGYGVVFGSFGRGGIFGSEAEFAWTNDFFGKGTEVEGSRVSTLMGNFLVALPLGPVRPYGALGLGIMKSRMEFTSASLTDFSDTSFGWDYGFGVMVLLPAHLGIRADLRRFRSSADLPVIGSVGDNKLRFSRATIGLVLH